MDRVEEFAAMVSEQPNNFPHLKYPVGTKFKRVYGKGKARFERMEVVINHYTTRNLNGLVIKETYLIGHDMLGQMVTEEVPVIVIDKAIYFHGIQT